MFNGNAMPSLADIAAVTGNGRNNDGMNCCGIFTEQTRK